jgi:riboflavin kinase/FMN adenylyltransferase
VELKRKTSPFNFWVQNCVRMLSVRILTETTTVLTPTAIALGNFDGVHIGHAAVIEPIVQGEAALIPSVVTFNPHPQEFFSGETRQLLTPKAEKAQALEKLGVEQLILLPFDRELAQLSAREFVEKILIAQLHARKVSVGEDFCFGYQRQGTAQDLKNLAESQGAQVIINPLKTDLAAALERVSSSRIRQALARGNLTQAQQMLGRPYQLWGLVIPGQKLGATLGFPTANLQLPPEKLLPRLGVYAVKVHLQSNLTRPGVMNIGYRPTVAGKSLSVEVHLFDWVQDLYGEELGVELIAFLRPEQQFQNLEALKMQIARDCQQAQEILAAL